MIEPGEALTKRDIERVATLLVTSIDDAIPSLLGPWYTRIFIRHLARSPHECLFIDRVNDQVEAVCVLSLDPESTYVRTLRATFPALLRAAPAALWSQPALRRFLRDAVSVQRKKTGGTTPAGPEITYMFTSRQHRGRGFGKRLVARVDAFLRARGVGVYDVRTIDDPANRALAFYDREGFDRVGHREEGGRRFVVFRKQLIEPR